MQVVNNKDLKYENQINAFKEKYAGKVFKTRNEYRDAALSAGVPMAVLERNGVVIHANRNIIIKVFNSLKEIVEELNAWADAYDEYDMPNYGNPLNYVIENGKIVCRSDMWVYFVDEA